MDYDNLLDLVKKRRSIRRFKPDPVPDEHIDKIIEVARWAPSGFNMQPWEFVVIRKPELRNKIVEYVMTYWDQGKLMESTREAWQGRPWRLKGVVDSGMDYTTAPVYILLLGDKRTRDGLPMGVRYSEERFQLIFMSSLANAFMHMHLAAATLGLASQWVSAVTTPFAHCMIKDLLGIPNEMVPYDMMALGYPATKPGGKYLRDKGEMVHFDDCSTGDFRSDADVRDFIKRARSWTMGAHQKKADPR
ncbi:MAG: nitroreductase family protein [Deltaproteobacteria bacterium]|nr:nitroreductase family protein [Deltaproteobacteria bacterium]MBW2137135.1 nitroreductase family protein [Deltaproteobacteria bacterium]